MIDGNLLPSLGLTPACPPKMDEATLARYTAEMGAEVQAFRGDSPVFYDSSVVDAWAAAKGYTIDRSWMNGDNPGLVIKMWREGVTYSMFFDAVPET